MGTERQRRGTRLTPEDKWQDRRGHEGRREGDDSAISPSGEIVIQDHIDNSDVDLPVDAAASRVTQARF